jgi:hypothetical protein
MLMSTDAKPKELFYWWHGEDLKDFLADLNARDLSTVRVEFHPATMRLFIVTAADGLKLLGKDGDCGYNFSHVCPPNCPPPGP